MMVFLRRGGHQTDVCLVQCWHARSIFKLPCFEIHTD